MRCALNRSGVAGAVFYRRHIQKAALSAGTVVTLLSWETTLDKILTVT
jgi:hypothetical protein